MEAIWEWFKDKAIKTSTKLIERFTGWDLDKEKEKRNARKLLIESSRNLLNEDISKNDFMLHPIYSQIRLYLSKETIETVEGNQENIGINTDTIEIVEGNGRHSGVNPFKQKILDEIAMLEKEWDLI